MPRTLSTSYHIPPVWYTCVFSLYSIAENCLLSSYMKYIAPWFSFRNYYGFCFFTNKKRQKPWFYKVSDACLAGDERIELPPKVLETPIIPFDQSPIYRKNLTPVAALNFLGTFILYLQNFTQKASNLTPSNNQRLFQSKLYSLLCMP